MRRFLRHDHVFFGFGTPYSYLLLKLKYLKNKIKAWRRVDYPKEMHELMKLKERMVKLDSCVESRMLSDAELAERRDGFQKIIDIEKVKVFDLKKNLGSNG